MVVYLPIAGLSLDISVLLFLGFIVGVLSGLFGVGGGVLMTPLLIFLGIPPTIAVGSEAPHVLASSISGAIAHWRRKNVDIKMGFILLIGGIAGSTVGVYIFKILIGFGQIDLIIQLLFINYLILFITFTISTVRIHTYITSIFRFKCAIITFITNPKF